jgi:hypothetical protein
MTGEQQVHAGFLDRVERQFLPSYGTLDLLADRHRK